MEKAENNCDWKDLPTEHNKIIELIYSLLSIYAHVSDKKHVRRAPRRASTPRVHSTTEPHRQSMNLP